MSTHEGGDNSETIFEFLLCDKLRTDQECCSDHPLILKLTCSCAIAFKVLISSAVVSP